MGFTVVSTETAGLFHMASSGKRSCADRRSYSVVKKKQPREKKIFRLIYHDGTIWGVWTLSSTDNHSKPMYRTDLAYDTPAEPGFTLNLKSRG